MIIDSALYNPDATPRAWLISKVNRISPDGIVRVTLAQDTYDQHNDYIERDDNGNIIGMWANYWNNYVEQPIAPESGDDIPVLITSQITCSGKPIIKVGGSAKTFTVTYYDKDGEIIPDKMPEGWEFYFGEDHVPNTLLTLTTEDNKVKVKFVGDDSYVGNILTVKCTSGDVVSSLNVDIQAL